MNARRWIAAALLALGLAGSAPANAEAWWASLSPRSHDAGWWARESSFQALNLVDVSQTLQIATDCRNNPTPRYQEAGFLFPECPNPARIIFTKGLVALGHYWVSNKADAPIARTFQYATVVPYVYVVGHNYELGLGFTW